MAWSRLVLVTGASGFLGRHLCAALVARGDRVRALYRRSVPPPELVAMSEGGGLELMRADLGEGPAAVRAFGADAVGRRVDAVIHSAALASDWGPMELFVASNYDATVGLLKSAREAGCERFAYISSAVVQGFGPHVNSSEEGPYYPLKYPYQITKRMTEEYVLAQNGDGLLTTAIRPCNVYGPGDLVSTYRMFDAILDGVFGYIGSGESLTCPLYVDDLCAGVLSALDRPEAAGQVILLSDGQKISWKRYALAMFAAVGSRKAPTRLPTALAYAAAWAMSVGARALGAREAPPLTMYRVEQASQDYHFSNEKARRLLGFEPRVFFEEGLARTAAAYLDRRATLVGAARG